MQRNLFGETDETVAARVVQGTGALAANFGVPPFSVLNAREGAWGDLKRAWVQRLHLRGEEGREEGDSYGDGVGGAKSIRKGVMSHITQGTAEELKERFAKAGVGVSIFDPVLAQLAYRWWNVPGGSILDPFGGGVTRGLVAGALGYPYTGIELRPEQVEANRAQAARLADEIPGFVMPTWVVGDSHDLDQLLPDKAPVDAVFSCPPYYDLEMYGGGDKDGSAFETYERFMLWYREIFAQAVARLRDNRFATVVVGEIRDERGGYRNFVGHNISVFRSLGLTYYNEVILVTPVGTLPVRSGATFQATRKVGKTHQNVLVFYKGQAPNRDIKGAFGRVATGLPGEE